MEVVDIETPNALAGLSSEKIGRLVRRLQENQAVSPVSDQQVAALIPDLARRYDPFPLTPVQEVYWAGQSGYFDLGTCGANVYSEFLFAQTSPPFLDRLDDALQKLVHRHDMLRALFRPSGQQEILPQAPGIDMERIDLRGKSPQAVQAELDRLRHRLKTRKTVANHWPPFEFIACQMDDQEVRLLSSISALVADGRSRTLLTQQLVELLENPHTEMPPLELSYRDYAEWWRNLAGTPVHRSAEAYWMALLNRLPSPPDLPLARPITPESPSPFTVRSLRLLEPAAWHNVKAAASRVGLTPTGLVTAVFSEALARRCQSPRSLLGVVGSFRPPIHPQINAVVGNFNTVYPLVVERGGAPFLDWAKQIQEQLSNALEHRHFSGFSVMRALRRVRNQSSHSAMPVLFNSVLEYRHPSYGKSGRTTVTNEAFSLRSLDATVYAPQVLLEPTVFEGTDGSLGCRWKAIDSAFAPGLMDLLVREFVTRLSTLAEDGAELRPAPSVMGSSEDHAPTCVPFPCNTMSVSSGTAEDVAPSVAPRTPVEAHLAEIWRETLGLGQVGVTDDFWQLGGNSLQAVLMLMRVEREMNRPLPVNLLAGGFTIERLATVIDPTPCARDEVS